VCFDLEFAKAFAGPIATVIAAAAAFTVSIAALKVTRRFGALQAGIAEEQKEIAKSQRDIAYDKLKHDLFDKRYDIYLHAKAIIERITGHPNEQHLATKTLRDLRLKMDEARFFFAPVELSIFDRIEQLVVVHETAQAMQPLVKDDNQLRIQAADRAAGAVSELAEIYMHFPRLMKDALGFTQLTSHPS
jgi:hypothetical protein